MAFHHACFVAKHGPTSRVSVSRPGKNYNCAICTFAINPGDKFTWIPNGAAKGSKAQPDHAPDSSTAEVQHAAPVAAPSTSLINLDALAEEMFTRLDGRISAAMEPEIREIQIAVKVGDGPSINVGLQHRVFPLALASVAAGVCTYLMGPSGSGKTHGSAAIAQALGREYFYTGKIDLKSDLLGYVDGFGKYHETPWYRACKANAKGLFNWDDMDFSDANAQGAFMMALAQRKCAFPNGETLEFPDLAIIAGGNTNGKGATAEYSGRNKLDAAVMNRFAVIEWGYDEDLEMATAPDTAWCKRVQALRAAVASKGLRGVLVTPRATYDGAKLLAAGIAQETVENMTALAGCTDEQRASVRAAA